MSWKYKMVACHPGMLQDNTPKQLFEVANEAGRDGWEMVGVVSVGGSLYGYFKKMRASEGRGEATSA